MPPVIEIYTIPTCPYCIRAKKLLRERKMDYVEYDVSENEENYEDMLSRSNGKKTVPQIFINDKHIGGCDDLVSLDAKKRLDQRIRF